MLFSHLYASQALVKLTFIHHLKIDWYRKYCTVTKPTWYKFRFILLLSINSFLTKKVITWHQVHCRTSSTDWGFVKDSAIGWLSIRILCRRLRHTRSSSPLVSRISSFSLVYDSPPTEWKDLCSRLKLVEVKLWWYHNHLEIFQGTRGTSWTVFQGVLCK